MQEHNKLREPVLADYLRLLTAASIWGSTFICNELALIDFSPIAITAYRVIGAAILLVTLSYWLEKSFTWSVRTFWLVAGISVLNTVVPFTLIGWGQLSVDSSTTGILLATSPFATLIFSHFLTKDDRFSWLKMFGLVLGFTGVCVLLAQGLNSNYGVSGMLLIMLAACCYALSSVLIRRLGSVSSLALATCTLLIAALIMLPVLFVMEPPWQQNYRTSSLAALLFLAAGPTALGYLLRTQIVKLNGAVFMSNVGYLIPLFAVFWSWLFLSHSPTSSMLIALVLIFSGIAIGQNRFRKVLGL